jgi:hypothetical protein
MLALVATLVAAAVPTLLNAKLETRSAADGLAPAFRALVSGRMATPVWIGYAVPTARRERICCFDAGHDSSFRRSAGCRLEGNRSINVSHVDGRGIAVLEPWVIVLYRASEGRVSDVHVYSDDCVLDAGGRPVIWLENVKPSESLALLRSVLDESRDEDALAAIAQHADSGADTLLVEFARRGTSGERRSQALFWLAQKASRKAVGEIERAIADDPETEVKKQAVFALSQLPAEEGVPHLIGLARSHRNPAVREQAFFWLGESEDPRALAFFEQILGK